jgi:hypothetical protein
MPYIVSKLAAGMEYAFYTKAANGKQIRQGCITVHGGAGVANRKTLVTPQGVLTQVTADEVKKLRANPLFAQHEKDGFMKVLDKDPRDADKAAADLRRDPGDQLTSGDYQAAGKNAPETGRKA